MLRLILTSRVYDVARETPLEPAPRLSRAPRATTCVLKREDLQPVFSFKLRGAYNRIAHLSDDERARGVITASAGNHAQGVAFAARHLGLRALIVMPQTTPEIKVEAVRELGAEVVLSGDSYADAKATLRRARGRDRAASFIHPFDDPLVIAGQGTIGTEILRHRLGDLGGDLRAGRRRRADRRHRQLRQGAAAGRSGSSASSRSRPTRCTSRSPPAGASRSITSASSPTASRCARSAS